MINSTSKLLEVLRRFVVSSLCYTPVFFNTQFGGMFSPFLTSKATSSLLTRSLSSASSMYKPKVCISLDVETDGPTPSDNSCLMIGVAVIKANGSPTPPRQNGTPAPKPSNSMPPWLIEKTSWCLEPQPGKHVDPSTKTEFWDRHPEVLTTIQKRARPADEVVPEVLKWINQVEAKYTIDRWICMPTSFDWQFLRGVVHVHGPPNSMAFLPHYAHCLSTTFRLAREIYNISKSDIGDCPDFTYTHHADDDAARQGWLYLRVMELMAARLKGMRSNSSLKRSRTEPAIIEDRK